jgi:hypothetical protein
VICPLFGSATSRSPSISSFVAITYFVFFQNG